MDEGPSVTIHSDGGWVPQNIEWSLMADPESWWSEEYFYADDPCPICDSAWWRCGHMISSKDDVSALRRHYHWLRIESMLGRQCAP